MNKKLYVGSLPFDVTEDQLHALFAPCGQVLSARLIIDKLTGQSKGFGFVEMASEDEAQSAIQKLNGSIVGARHIIVNEARPIEHRNSNAFSYGARPAEGALGSRRRVGGGRSGGFNRW